MVVYTLCNSLICLKHMKRVSMQSCIIVNVNVSLIFCSSSETERTGRVRERVENVRKEVEQRWSVPIQRLPDRFLQGCVSWESLGGRSLRYHFERIHEERQRNSRHRNQGFEKWVPGSIIILWLIEYIEVLYILWRVLQASFKRVAEKQRSCLDK